RGGVGAARALPQAPQDGAAGRRPEARRHPPRPPRRPGRDAPPRRPGARAAPAGAGSRWITGPQARADVHRLRSESDAVLVGAGTVRADDPELTVRLAEGADPKRVVLGRAREGGRVLPAREVEGPLDAILDDLGSQGVLQLLVEGGATV